MLNGVPLGRQPCGTNEAELQILDIVHMASKLAAPSLYEFQRNNSDLLFTWAWRGLLKAPKLDSCSVVDGK